MRTNGSKLGHASDGLLSGEELERLANLNFDYASRGHHGEKNERILEDIKSQLMSEENPLADVWAYAVKQGYESKDAKYRVMRDWINDWITKVENGQAFGRFSKFQKLGAGGFGVVFRAYDVSRQSDVAVKLPLLKLKPGSKTTVIDVPEWVHQLTSFFAEVQRHVPITVPGCVAIHDTGLPKTFSVDQVLVHLRNEPIWFSMQFIRGDSLRKVLSDDYVAGETIPDDKIIGLITTIAERLHGLHSAVFSDGGGNVLHLDIKPENILLDENSVPWLADFGLTVSTKKSSSARSQGGGTPGYMSPEQLTIGEKIDCRSDVFSLGVVLYELLCGCLPFADENEAKKKQPEHPRKKRASITPELAEICLKALSKLPSDRYQTAQEMANALRGCRWFHQGVAQLLNVGRLADAIEFVSFIPQIEPAIQASQTGYLQQEIGMILSAVLNGKSRSVGKNERPINAKKLWNLHSDCYATSDLEKLIGWFGQTQNHEGWRELIGLFLKTNDYVVRYAAGCGQAKRFEHLVDQNQMKQAIEEIDWLFCRDADHQEVACYAIAQIGKSNRVPLEAQRWFESRLQKMSSSKFYFARSALGDMLIDWSVNKRGAEIERLGKKIEGFWNPIWDYLRLDVVAVAAANPALPQSVAMRTTPDLRKEIEGHSQLIKDLRNARRPELLRTFRRPRKLANLIRTHLDDESQDPSERDHESENPGDWESMQALFRGARYGGDASGRRFEELVSLFRFLFSHPSWSEAEDVAAILQKVADRSECRKVVFQVVDQLLSDKDENNWRVQFGALEATFLLRHVDPQRFDKSAFPERGNINELEFGRFGNNISKLYKHEVCLIRGLCAEDFVADLFARSPAEWIGRLKYFQFAIVRWLQDDDCWVLEHMFRLFRKLAVQTKSGTISGLSSWMTETLRASQKDKASLLSRIGSGWYELTRHPFLSKLEKCRREQLQSKRKHAPLGH